MTRLEEVIQSGDLSLIKKYIDEGDKITINSLDLAVKTGNSDIVSAVINAGGKVTANSLDLAVKTGNSDIVSAVINAGGKVLAYSLNLAVKIGVSDIVSAVINAGGQVTSYSLDLAVKTGNSGIVSAVINAGGTVTPNSLDLAIETGVSDIVFSIVRLAPNLVTSDFFLKSKHMESSELENFILEQTGRTITDFKSEEYLSNEHIESVELSNNANSIQKAPIRDVLEYHETIRVALGKSFFNFFTNASTFLSSVPKENGILCLGDYFYNTIGSAYIQYLNNKPAEFDSCFSDSFIEGFSSFLARNSVIENIIQDKSSAFFTNNASKLFKEEARKQLATLFVNIPIYDVESTLSSLWHNQPIRACFYCAICLLDDVSIPKEHLRLDDTITFLSEENLFPNAIEELNNRNDELLGLRPNP